MGKRNNIVRYIVKDSEGKYINSYSTLLGDNIAYKYAKECARLSKGIVFSQDTEQNERKLYDNS
jgi:hypothetical protein